MKKKHGDLHMKKKKTKVDKSSNIITWIKILGLVLPLILYLMITQYVFPCPNSAFLCLGYLGCFFIGLGLFNLIGLLDGASFGTAVTLFLLGIGGLLVTFVAGDIVNPGYLKK